MRDITQPPHICCIDPMTAFSAAAMGAIPALFGGGNKPAAAPTPEAPPAPPPPESAPMGQKKQPGQSGASFIGSVPTPPSSTGSKTLLGQ
jgi:hypothetical protein